MIHYAEPVTGKYFFAREDIISELAKSAESIKQGYRQNIAIVGSSLIGKSSLLLHFLGSLSNDKYIIPVYIDMQCANIREFILKFIKSAFYNTVKKRINISPPADIDQLLENAQAIFPKSCDLARRVLKLTDEANMDDAFSEAWDIPAFLAAESGCFVLMAVDEFNQISSFNTDKPYQVLGRKIMTQQKTLFIFSSSSAVKAKKILSEKLSLLFGGFKVIDICPFSPEQSKDFIRIRLKGIKIPKVMVDFIVSFTGGHPFYLSAITGRIGLANNYGAYKITEKRLSGMMAELLFCPAGVLNQFFYNKVSEINSLASGTGIFDVLKSFIKTGCLSDISSRSTVPPAELNSIACSLLELGFAQKSGSLYAITDPMFRMWIEVKSKSRNLCFDFMPKQEWDDYSAEIHARIVSFKAEQVKNLESRLIELINSFNNDHFFIDERVRVLPKVENISLKKYRKYDILISQASKKKCLFILCRKKMDEEDIAGIYERLKNFKTAKPKTIIIASFGIEQAARLLAKQRSFCIWDKSDISRLFNFYKGYNALIA
jgi:AAA+ ATPase superfamily predicted ATPase